MLHSEWTSRTTGLLLASSSGIQNEGDTRMQHQANTRSYRWLDLPNGILFWVILTMK
jgi:hypothetical protein